MLTSLSPRLVPPPLIPIRTPDLASEIDEGYESESLGDQKPAKLEDRFHILFQELLTEKNGDVIEALKKIDIDNQHQPLSHDNIKELFALAETFGKALREGQDKQEIIRIMRRIQNDFGLNGSCALAVVSHIFGMFPRTGEKRDISPILTHIFFDHLAMEGVFRGETLSSKPSQCLEDMRGLLYKKINKEARDAIGYALCDFWLGKELGPTPNALVSPQEARTYRKILLENTHMPLSEAELAQRPKKFEELWVNSFREMMINVTVNDWKKARDITGTIIKPVLEAMKKNYTDPKEPFGSFFHYIETRVKDFNKVATEQGYGDFVKNVDLNHLFQSCERYFRALDDNKQMEAKRIARKIQNDYGLSGAFVARYMIAKVLMFPNQFSIGNSLAPIFNDYVARKPWTKLSQSAIDQKMKDIFNGMHYSDSELVKQIENLKKASPDLNLERRCIIDPDSSVNLSVVINDLFSQPEKTANTSVKHYLKSA